MFSASVAIISSTTPASKLILSARHSIKMEELVYPAILALLCKTVNACSSDCRIVDLYEQIIQIFDNS